MAVRFWGARAPRSLISALSPKLSEETPECVQVIREVCDGEAPITSERGAHASQRRNNHLGVGR